MHDFTEWPAPAKALAGLFTILVVAALWSMLASSLFLLGTGLIRSFHGWPLMEWWTYWRFYGFEQPVVGIWLKISGAAAAGVPLLLLVVGLMRRGLPAAIRPLHGATRWAAPPSCAASSGRGSPVSTSGTRQAFLVVAVTCGSAGPSTWPATPRREAARAWAS